MSTIDPRQRARLAKPLVGIGAIERMLRRQADSAIPETRLVVVVICLAMADCVAGEPEIRADAQAFMCDWRLDAWAQAVGLNPEFVREVAVKAGYLDLEKEPQAVAARNTQQDSIKRTLHA
jgi:hypothetical protein